MLDRESNDEASILREIKMIKQQLNNINNKTYDILMQRKMLNHKLADLEYELNHLEDDAHADLL